MIVMRAEYVNICRTLRKKKKPCDLLEFTFNILPFIFCTQIFPHLIPMLPYPEKSVYLKIFIDVIKVQI